MVRYYSVADGRFTSRDVWDGDNQMPMSYNAWLYGYENPMVWVDPSGWTACTNSYKYFQLSGEWEGAFIDVDHWYDGFVITEKIFKMLAENIGVKNAQTFLSHRFITIPVIHKPFNINARYLLNIPEQMNEKP